MQQECVKEDLPRQTEGPLFCKAPAIPHPQHNWLQKSISKQTDNLEFFFTLVLSPNASRMHG